MERDTVELLTIGEGAAVTRADHAVITADALTKVWPEVSHRLAKLLTSRGAAPDVVDDVVQEVAARVLARSIVFDDAMDLMRWAVPVALNLLVDNARAAARIATGAIEDYDRPTGDVADLVVHRDRLHRTVRAVGAMSPADRAALASAKDAAGDRREAVKLAVRRHRARRRLMAVVDGAVGVFVWVAARARRSRGAAATVPVAVMVPVALLVHLPGAPPDRSPVPPRPAVAAARPAQPDVTAPTRSRAARSGAARRVARAVGPRRTPRTVPAGRPAPPAPPGRRVVSGGDPGAGRVTVVEREPEPGDGLVCVRGVEPLAGGCLLAHHPDDPPRNLGPGA